MSKILLILMGSAATCLPAHAAEVVHLPDSWQYTTIHANVPVENSTDAPLHVTGVTQANVRGKITLAAPLTVAPHATGYADLAIDTENNLGLSNYHVSLATDAKQAQTVDAALQGFVQTILDDERPQLDFNVVAKGLTPEQHTTLASRGMANFKLTKLLEAPEWVTASIDADGRTIRARVKPARPLGIVDGFVKLQTNSVEQPQVWVLAKMDSRGSVVPSANPVDFSILRQGKGGEQSVRLEQALHEPFQIESVKVDGAAISATVSGCAPDVVWCKQLRLNADKNIASGQIWARANVHVAGTGETVPIELRGMVFPANLKIIDLNDPKYRATQSKAASQQGGDLKQMLQHAAEPQKSPAVAPADFPPGGATLRWDVDSDANVYGYEVYRADAEKGPFVRVNADLVRTDMTGKGGHYAWHDTSAQKGHEYWYYIGMVYMNGHRQQLSGAEKATGK